MRVGFYQFCPVFGHVHLNREKVVEKLSRVEADLLVLPELAFTGYHFRERAEIFPLAEDPADSPTIDSLAELCGRQNFFIVTGFAEKRGKQLYNSAVLIGPDGLIHVYRKIQLFLNEKGIFQPGNIPLQVQEVKGVKIGMMICFDWIFPEISRILALQGADIICHPSNLVLSYCQSAMLTRCLENSVFAITANRFGIESRPHGNLRFTGKSQIVSPTGILLYRARSQREELMILEIDPILARDKKMTEKNDLITDRRPEMYTALCRPLKIAAKNVKKNSFD
jgi:predicted amidohydrolase